MSILIFFDDLNFQIVEINAFYKIVFCETGLFVALEFGYGLVQPDRHA